MRSYLYFLAILSVVTLYPRKSHAMEITPKQPSIGQSTLQDKPTLGEVAPKIGTEVMNPAKGAGKLEQQGSGSQTIPSFQGETQELGGGASPPSDGTQQLGAATSSRTPKISSGIPSSSGGSGADSIKSKFLRRLGISDTYKQINRLERVRGFESSGSGPPNVGSLSISRARDVYNETEYSLQCCGRPVPLTKIVAKKKEYFFTSLQATDSLEEWNEKATRIYKRDAKKFTLTDERDARAKLSAADPMYAFSEKDKPEITAFIEQVNKEAGKSKTKSKTKLRPNRNPEKAPVSQELSTTQGFPTKQAFCSTIPKGECVEAFNFIDNYTDRQPKAKDNYGHTLYYAKIEDEQGQAEALINPDYAHRATGDARSSVHADIYFRKGESWSNAGAVSNHTGIGIGTPTTEKKLKRFAKFNPNP